MKIAELVAEYAEARAVGLMLTDPELTHCAMRAVRALAAHSRIASLSQTDLQPAAGGTPADPEPEVTEAYPVKDLAQLTPDTELSVGEWVLASPLFYLYVELLNSTRLEASRAGGIDAFGRSSSEIQQDINVMENETLPQKAYSAVIVTIE